MYSTYFRGLKAFGENVMQNLRKTQLSIMEYVHCFRDGTIQWKSCVPMLSQVVDIVSVFLTPSSSVYHPFDQRTLSSCSLYLLTGSPYNPGLNTCPPIAWEEWFICNPITADLRSLLQQFSSCVKERNLSLSY